VNTWFFVSDLHGNIERYLKLIEAIEREKPTTVLLGGDLFPSGLAAFLAGRSSSPDFLHDFLVTEFTGLRERMGNDYPRVLLILGNDDGRAEEQATIAAGATGLWEYLHQRRVSCHGFNIYGYSFIPPSPFQLKDWERYDVSRYVDPGCVSPEEGGYSVPVSNDTKRYATIQNDLDQLTRDHDLARAIFLFHTPPYRTKLDRAALDGKMIDYVPLDVHIGSIAVQRFIESRQPLITLHGHVHESPRLTGAWRDQIGRTHLFSAAHDGSELALVRFDPEHPAKAERELL
jgi:Icc-related predicted phosphoesterase